MPAKTLLLLALVPWADGLSVSEAIRRRRGRETSPEARRVYGLAIWIPVAMMGLAYLAAAFAKLDETGIRWVTDGVVRYFFIVDAPNAPSDLGRFVAASDGLSVLLAAGAVLTEACIIVGALYPRPLVVLAAGLGALALHEGFWLFQGVWWPAWWALLPAFVPWSLVARWLERSTTSTQWVTNDSRPIVDGVPLATAAILGLVVFQQPVVSLLRVEHRPLFSDFSMYSDSQWVSKQDFAAYMDRERRPDYPAVRLTGAGETDPAVIEARLRDVDPEKVVIDAARLVAGGIVPDETRRERVRAIGERYQERFGAPMLPLQIASASWHFDWSVADFAPNAAWQPSGVLEASAKP